MRKLLVLSFSMFSAATSLADTLRPFSTNNLNCNGKAETGEKITLTIRSSPSGSDISTGNSDHNPDTQMAVTSEGLTYIQVVNNKLNLYLSGDGLDPILVGPAQTTKAVKLTGKITYFSGRTFELKCTGTLTAN